MPNYRHYKKRLKSHSIDVCEKGKRYGEPGAVITTIKRVINARPMGNYNPVFCTYKGREYLVHSRLGDISDPFRITKEHFQSLYFEIGKDEC